MRKTIIEVWADLVGCVYTREAAKFAVNDWHNNSLYIANNSENKANINFANIDLAEFGVHTKTLLANSIR